jgi:hypothetical protein
MIELFPQMILNIKVLNISINNCILGDLMDASYRLRQFKSKAARLHEIYLSTIPFSKDKKEI